jgi:hypothetical protein
MDRATGHRRVQVTHRRGSVRLWDARRFRPERFDVSRQNPSMRSLLRGFGLSSRSLSGALLLPVPSTYSVHLVNVDFRPA